MFFFLAGTGAFLYRNRAGSVGAIARFLWTRGVWLVILEWTIIDFAWTFVPWQFGGVIWSLGSSMVVLAALVWLPEWAILTFGLALVGLHDLFDRVQAAQLGSLDWLWVLLHRRGDLPGTHFFVLFPVVPWLGVMALGYAAATVLLRRVVACISRPARNLALSVRGPAYTRESTAERSSPRYRPA